MSAAAHANVVHCWLVPPPCPAPQSDPGPKRARLDPPTPAGAGPSQPQGALARAAAALKAQAQQQQQRQQQHAGRSSGAGGSNVTNKDIYGGKTKFAELLTPATAATGGGKGRVGTHSAGSAQAHYIIPIL